MTITKLTTGQFWSGRQSAARYSWLLIPVLLLTTWLGARRLNTSGIWYDEWWSLYDSGASYFGPPLLPAAIWNRIATEDPMYPPGYYVLLAAWAQGTGWSEDATRALSLLAGLIAVACTYQLGRTLTGDPLVGLGAAVALGASVWFMRFLYEMRCYTVFVALSALFMLLFVRLKHPSPGLYAAFTLTGAALLYTHYFAVLPFGVIGLWHLIRFRRSRQWWMILSCMVIAGLLYLPWVGNALPALGLRAKVNQVDADSLQLAGEMLTIFSNASVALFALLALAGLRIPNGRTIWTLAIVLLVVNLAAMRVLRLNELRYMMDILPLLALIVGLGVRALAAVGPGIFLALWIASALLVEGDPALQNVIQRFPSEPVRDMAQVVGPYLRENDAVINILGDSLRSTIQYTPLMFYFGNLPGHKEVVERVFLPSVPAFVNRVQEAVGSAQHVWVLYSPQWHSTEWSLFLNLLDQWKFQPCLTLADSPAMRIIGFARMDQAGPTVTFDNGIGAHLIEAPALRDGALMTWIGFNTPPGMSSDQYSFSVQLSDSSGALRAQYDNGLPGNGCRLARLDVTQLPPGKYQLKLIVYNWRTLARLSGVGAEGSKGDSLTLAGVTK